MWAVFLTPGKRLVLAVFAEKKHKKDENKG